MAIAERSAPVVTRRRFTVAEYRMAEAGMADQTAALRQGCIVKRGLRMRRAHPRDPADLRYVQDFFDLAASEDKGYRTATRTGVTIPLPLARSASPPVRRRSVHSLATDLVVLG